MRIEELILDIKNTVNDSFTKLDFWFDEKSDLLRYKPINGGWSAIEILEHVMLTSHFLLLLIDKGGTKAMKRSQTMGVDADWDQYVLASKSLLEIGKNESFKWIRPDHMEPKGNLTDSDIRIKLISQKERCIEWLFLLKNGEGVLSVTTMSVNGLGKLDVYQYIYFLTLHTNRHLEQLEKNRNEFEKK